MNLECYECGQEWNRGKPAHLLCPNDKDKAFLCDDCVQKHKDELASSTIVKHTCDCVVYKSEVLERPWSQEPWVASPEYFLLAEEFRALFPNAAAKYFGLVRPAASEFVI